MSETKTRSDLEFDLDFATIYLANGLDALATLVEGCRDQPCPEKLGHLLMHSAHYAEHVREIAIKLVYMKP